MFLTKNQRVDRHRRQQLEESERQFREEMAARQRDPRSRAEDGYVNVASAVGGEDVEVWRMRATIAAHEYAASQGADLPLAAIQTTMDCCLRNGHLTPETYMEKLDRLIGDYPSSSWP